MIPSKLTACGASLLLAVFLVPVEGKRAWAEESVTEDQVAPDTVEGLDGNLEKTFEEEDVEVARFPRLKRKLEDLPPFFRDTTLKLKTRTYYRRTDNFDNSKTEAWAAGGSVDYQSGWFKDRLQIGAEFFTSQKLYGPGDRDGTGLLATGQHHYNVLGRAYGKLKLADKHVVTAYRQYYQLPYINKNDGRITPNTFEGYSLQGTFERKGKRPEIEYIGGYIARMKKRNSDTFVSMGEAAGAEGDPSRGVVVFGARVAPTEDFSFGALNYFSDDVLNIFYVETDYTHHLTDKIAMRFKAQFTDQRSVGDNLLTGSPFDTHVGSGKAALSYVNAILSVAFSTTSKEQQIQSPWGSYPGYISLMVNDFDRAGEDAWLVGFSYDFKKVGLNGLSAFANVARGSGAIDPVTGAGLPDQTELDVTVDYKLPEGRFKGLWIRVRGALTEQDGVDNSLTDYRVIVRYEIPLL